MDIYIFKTYIFNSSSTYHITQATDTRLDSPAKSISTISSISSTTFSRTA